MFGSSPSPRAEWRFFWLSPWCGSCCNTCIARHRSVVSATETFVANDDVVALSPSSSAAFLEDSWHLPLSFWPSRQETHAFGGIPWVGRLAIIHNLILYLFFVSDELNLTVWFKSNWRIIIRLLSLTGNIDGENLIPAEKLLVNFAALVPIQLWWWSMTLDFNYIIIIWTSHNIEWCNQCLFASWSCELTEMTHSWIHHCCCHWCQGPLMKHAVNDKSMYIAKSWHHQKSKQKFVGDVGFLHNYFFDQGINIAIRQRALALQDLAVNIQMLVTVVNDSKHNFQRQLKQVNDKSMVVSVTVSSWSMCKHWGTPQAFFCCAKDTKYTEHPLPKAHNPEGSGTPLLCSSLLIPLSVHHEP